MSRGTSPPGAIFRMSHYDGKTSQKLFQQNPIKKDAAIFSLSAKKSGNKFMSHLLGLDHEEGSNAKANQENIFKSIKFTDLLHGIKITPNFLFLCLFMGFFFWLFVIYWIRHHEPLANQVLGTPKVDPERAAIDMKLVAGVKQAFPVQTSATTGEIYVPGSPVAAYQTQDPKQPQTNGSTQAAQITTSTQSTNVNSPAPAIAPAAAAYNSQVQYPNYGATPQNYAGMSSLPGQHGSYIIGIQTESGNTRARTVVSR